jgi:hypothetical protein
VAAAGVVWLIYRPGRVVRSDDPTATADTLRSSATLFRVAFVSDLVAGTCRLLTAVALYVSLRHVHQLIAAAVVTFVATGTAISSLGLLNQYTALALATDTTYALRSDDRSRSGVHPIRMSKPLREDELRDSYRVRGVSQNHPDLTLAAREQWRPASTDSGLPRWQHHPLLDHESRTFPCSAIVCDVLGLPPASRAYANAQCVELAFSPAHDRRRIRDRPVCLNRSG